VTGNYSLTFWAQSEEGDGCNDLCSINVVVNGLSVNYYQLNVPQSEYTQFSVDLGGFNPSTTVQVGITDYSCCAATLWLDDLGIVLV
jgi:hypothetical protein